MGKALYRKYRSKSLGEIMGQGHVTDILAQSLEKDRVAHAYLLTGPKGVGKTSIARILAHEINQLPYTDESTHLDIIEIDAASNNGVEDVRDLREKVQIAPVSASKKVYIIDEVHMLSKPAFNALLKTLEEPPEHVVFILATTDVDKLPATIISRTQRFGLRAMAKDDGIKHLRMIAEKENIKIDDAALEILVERGDGSFRNSVSLLDQISSLADDKTGITPELIEATLGLAPHDAVTTLLTAVKTHDTATIIKQLDEFEKSGIQATILTSQLISAIRTSIAEHPRLIDLLDTLLDVNKSSHPNIKLLTTLVAFATPKPKTAALAAPAPSISKPVNELVSSDTLSIKQSRGARAIVSQGTQDEVRPAVVKDRSSVEDGTSPAVEDSAFPAAASQERKLDQLAASESETAGDVTAEQNKEDPPKTDPMGDNQNNKPMEGASNDFDWSRLIDYVRTHHIAIHSVLNRCGYELDGDTLKLYTGTPFYKKKLDDTKYRPLITQSLINTGAGDLVIETIPTPPPPKDSQAAAVAAIMGGGEEINVSE